MELNEKLQKLRKEKGLTQEEVAAALFVSRTAVSKWESGRGYPNIDSLKGIAKLYSVTVDDLISGEEILILATEEQKQKEERVRDLVFGLLDAASAMLLFLPFFAQKGPNGMHEVSLLSLKTNSAVLGSSFLAVVIALTLFGILTLALQSCNRSLWMKIKKPISLGLSILGALLFIAGLQPYGAVYLFVFFIIKVLTLLRR